ncbi:MAG: AAA family ATPase [Bacteroidota bacterium]
MKLLAIYNLKGGVGKTATTVNLAYLAAAEGYKTLLIDMDPQAASSFYFGLDGEADANAVKRMAKGNYDIADNICDSGYENLDILPSNSDYRKIELYLNDLKDSSRWLSDFVKPIKREYDLVILDCPPNITLLTENIFRNSDFILVPVVPTTLTVRTYEQILDYFSSHRLNKDKLIPFFSMFERRKKLHNEISRDFARKFKETISVLIPYSSEVEKMGIYRAPLTFKRPSEEASKAFRKLWKGVKKKMDI